VIQCIHHPLYILLRDGYFHFQTSFGTGCLTFPWMGWFRSYRFWDGLQFFLPFNSRFLDVDRQKLCEKSAVLERMATSLLCVGEQRRESGNGSHCNRSLETGRFRSSLAEKWDIRLPRGRTVFCQLPSHLFTEQHSIVLTHLTNDRSNPLKSFLFLCLQDAGKSAPRSISWNSHQLIILQENTSSSEMQIFTQLIDLC
jgi:hypothetical protein